VSHGVANAAKDAVVELRGSSSDWRIDKASIHRGSEGGNTPRRIVDDQTTGAGNNRVFTEGGLEIHKTIALSTAGATTNTGIIPDRVIKLEACVAEVITGLDSFDHHVQVGVSGTPGKYVDIANGAAATSIAVNKKGHYSGAPVAEGSELIITITGGSDRTPSGGALELRLVHDTEDDLPDVV
jgi:hypothetical protein